MIFCGDFFSLTPDMLEGPVNCVFDRGSLVAVEAEDRARYARLMDELLRGAPEFRYLLLVYEYDQELFSGPPRAVFRKEIDELYSKKICFDLSVA